MTASGTCALQLALMALKLRHGRVAGDEVIVPAVTVVATANVVIRSGLKPLFLDVDPAYDKVEAAAREVRVGRC